MTLRREAFLGHVKERGKYDTTEEAERAARVVLALLGAHLVGDVRAQLAARLPEAFALILLNPLQSAEPLPPERFVRATAAWIEGATDRRFGKASPRPRGRPQGAAESGRSGRCHPRQPP
ncbi:DUF2267 domain-containing protein [Streptomyces sp. NPDC004393]